MSMKRHHSGFTLVELMMVVATIGILAAIALPAYQDYIIRSKMAEAFVVADLGKRAVNEYYERWGAFPEANAQAGLPAPETFRSRYVGEMRVVQGMVQLSVALGGAFEKAPKELSFNFYLRPIVNKAYPTGPLGWTCSPSEKGLTGLPMEVVGKAGSDVPPRKYLPASCR
jgi:type IV pilus assembly protein PilA